MVGGPCCKLSYFLPVSADASTETEKAFTNCHCQKALPLAFRGVLSGSVSLDSVDSSWMFSNSPVNHAVQSPRLSLLQQNQGLGRRTGCCVNCVELLIYALQRS